MAASHCRMKGKKGRNTDITRDREVVNARVSLAHRSVEQRKSTFRVHRRDIVPLWSTVVDPPRLPLRLNVIASSPTSGSITVVDDMLILFEIRMFERFK